MPNEDLDKLQEGLTPFAVQAVQKAGFFRPFGAQIMSDGKFALATADGDDINQVLFMLMSGLKMAAGDGAIRAGGVCYCHMDPNAESKADHTRLILILETTDGQIRYVTTPFRKRFLRGVMFGDATVEEKTGRQIFADEDDAQQSLGGDSENRAEDGTVSEAPQG